MTDSICMNVKRNLILSALPLAFVLGGIVTTATGHGFYTVQLSGDSEPVVETTTTLLPVETTTTTVVVEPVVEAPVVTEAPQPTPTTVAPKPTTAPAAGHKVPARTNVTPGDPSCDAGYALTPTGCVKVAEHTTTIPPTFAPRPVEAS